MVEAAFREQLKRTYPATQVVTVNNGLFPYISTPDDYTELSRKFCSENKCFEKGFSGGSYIKNRPKKEKTKKISATAFESLTSW